LPIVFEGLSFPPPLVGEVGGNDFGFGARRGVFASACQLQPPSLTLPLKGGGDTHHAWQRLLA